MTGNTLQQPTNHMENMVVPTLGRELGDSLRRINGYNTVNGNSGLCVRLLQLALLERFLPVGRIVLKRTDVSKEPQSIAHAG
jgi:hypothetical protein